MTAAVPQFPHCAGCDQRLNVWTIDYCIQCQIALNTTAGTSATTPERTHS